jgi:hypothetical protein
MLATFARMPLPIPGSRVQTSHCSLPTSKRGKELPDDILVGFNLPPMYLEARWVDGRQAVASLRIFRGALPGRRSRLERWLLYLVVFVALNCALLWVLSIDDNMIVSLPFRSGSWKQKSSGPARSRDPYTAMGSTRASLPPEAIFRASQAHEVEDGLLKVNMESKLNPVYQLIRDARTAWNNKLARQSQSLKEAVQEYRRRYGRHPPKGFDRWWRYVKYVLLKLVPRLAWIESHHVSLLQSSRRTLLTLLTEPTTSPFLMSTTRLNGISSPSVLCRHRNSVGARTS